MGKLTELTTTGFSKAQVITTRLESKGIECFLKFMEPHFMGHSGDIKILVAEEQIEIAKHHLRELIQDIEPQYTADSVIEAFSGLYIIPVDFSIASFNACCIALQLASKFKSRVKIVHTYGLPEIRPMSFDDTDFYTGTLTAHLNELKQEAEIKISELLSNLKEFITKNSLNDIPLSVSLVNGLPDEITIYTAENEMAGLIIMGISRKDIRTFEPIGKIASRVVEKASCPVLIIPEEYSQINGTLFKNMLYATAFDEIDFAAIQKLIVLIKMLKSKIHILHVGNEEGDPWDNIKIEGLRDYFAKAYSYTDVTCNLKYSKDIMSTINQYIQENNIDIISMITHKRNLIWKLINPSLTKKIVYHTKIPLLVFHA